MKKLLPLLLCLLLLCGCAAQTVKEVNVSGYSFTVDTQNQTVRDRRDVVYTYSVSGNTVRITYPDDSWYTRSLGGVGISSWSDDYDCGPFSENYYTDGAYLTDAVIEALENKTIPARNVIMGIMLLILGMVYAIWPGIGWKIRYSAWVRDAEPTEFALGFGRAIGILCVIAGVLAFFLW